MGAEQLNILGEDKRLPKQHMTRILKVNGSFLGKEGMKVVGVC